MNDYEQPVSDRESWWRSTIKVIILLRLHETYIQK